MTIIFCPAEAGACRQLAADHRVVLRAGRGAPSTIARPMNVTSRSTGVDADQHDAFDFAAVLASACA
jgi:hypothetical protein